MSKVKPKTKEKSVGGRPTDYDESMNEQVMKLCLLGMTDEEISQFLEIETSTFYLWKKKYPKFSEAIKKGKEDADAEVAHKLFRRASGYSHPETHVSNVGGEIVLTPLEKHYPPDTAAAFIWLKNRRPKTWRDKQEIEHSGNVGSDMSEDKVMEQARRVAFLLNKAVLKKR